MSLDPSSFVVHDIRRFPTIVVRSGAVQPGYAVQWEKEMDRLIAYGAAFAVVYLEMPRDETHDDFKRRGLWLKKNKTMLALLCKALITVEPDDVAREAARIRGLGATRAFGVPHHAVADADEAFDIGRA